MISNSSEMVKIWIKRTISDPLVKSLLINSQLTQIQLETLLIDLLGEQLIEKKISSKEKVTMRLENKKISRGSFDRTLRQARTNMIKSIFTVILLGYIGIFESPTLNQYLELANKLEKYMTEYRLNRSDFNNKNTEKAINIIKENIKNDIYSLFPTQKRK